MVENFDLLQTFVPKSYPRIVVEQETAGRALFYVSLSFALLALVSVLLATVGIIRHRKKRAVRYAQVQFLCLLLAGLFMVAVASVLLNIPASDASCMSINWLVLQGYTFELVPLILKVAAVAHISSAAKRFKRVRVEQKLLFTVVFALCGLLIVFLSVWTVVDPSKETADFELTEDTTEEGDVIIIKSFYCQSESEAWMFINTGWHGILLLASTVLAFQTRNLRKEINESLALAVLVYSHAIFAILRVILFYLQDRFYVWNLAHYESLIFSVDVIAACCIYFFPKLLCSEDNKVSVFNNIPIIRNISRLLPPLATELENSHSGKRGRGEVDAMSIHLNSSDDQAEDDSLGVKDELCRVVNRDSMGTLGGDDSFLNGEDSFQAFSRSKSMVESFALESSDNAPPESLVKPPRRRTSEDLRLIVSCHNQRRTMTEESKQHGVSVLAHQHGQHRGNNTLWRTSISEAEADSVHTDSSRNAPEAGWEKSGKRHSLQPTLRSKTAGVASNSWSSDRGFLANLPGQLKEEVGPWQDEVTDEVSI